MTTTTKRHRCEHCHAEGKFTYHSKIKLHVRHMMHKHYNLLSNAYLEGYAAGLAGK